jgi:hypothetical protein
MTKLLSMMALVSLGFGAFQSVDARIIERSPQNTCAGYDQINSGENKNSVPGYGAPQPYGGVQVAPPNVPTPSGRGRQVMPGDAVSGANYNGLSVDGQVKGMISNDNRQLHSGAAGLRARAIERLITR